MAITHEYETAWKRVLHYFDLHLNKRLNKQPPCWLLNASIRRQVTVMASQLPANRMFVQQSVQIGNKEISKVCVIVPLWGEATVTSGSPHKRRVTWKMLLLDDVIMDWRVPWRHMYHITLYILYITVINQTMLKRGRNVGIPLFFCFCYRWVRFLRTITPSVTSNHLAECGRWAPKVTKGLTESFAGKTFEVFIRFKPNLMCPLGWRVDGAHQLQSKKWCIVNRI